MLRLCRTEKGQFNGSFHFLQITKVCVKERYSSLLTTFCCHFILVMHEMTLFIKNTEDNMGVSTFSKTSFSILIIKSVYLLSSSHNFTVLQPSDIQFLITGEYSRC